MLSIEGSSRFFRVKFKLANPPSASGAKDGSRLHFWKFEMIGVCSNYTDQFRQCATFYFLSCKTDTLVLPFPTVTVMTFAIICHEMIGIVILFVIEAVIMMVYCIIVLVSELFINDLLIIAVIIIQIFGPTKSPMELGVLQVGI